MDRLLQTREKKKTDFEKTKKELNAVSKEISIAKLKLFEILQSGSDDTTFSNWAKRKISENGKTVKNENGNFAKPEKPMLQNHQNQQSYIQQNPNQRQ